MSQDSVQISLNVATEAAEQALKNFQAQTEGATKKFDVFKGVLGANVAFEALKTGFGAIKDTFSAMIDEASKAEQSVKRMEVALAQAGLAGQGNSQYFQAFADSLERTTAFSGDAAESAVTLFASLNNLSRDGIVQATQASADLAATLGIDLGQASEMVSKAINGQMTGFNKLGIEIQKGTTDAENLANVLKALQGQQGAAAASSNTYAGALAKLENQQGKLLENVGKLITQNPAVIDGMNTLTGIFEGLAGFIERNSENITLFAKSLVAAAFTVGVVTASIWLFNAGLVGLSTAWTSVAVAASAAWTAMTGGLWPIIIASVVALGAAIYVVVKYWDQIKIATLEATAAVLDYAAKAAGVFSSSAAANLQAEAQALRDKAQATREVIAAQSQQSAPEPERQTQSANAKAEIENTKRINQEKLQAQFEFNSQKLLLDQDLATQQQELELEHSTAMSEIRYGTTASDLQSEFAAQEQLLLSRQAFEQEQLNAQIQASVAKAQLVQDDVQREKAIRDANYQAQLDQQKLSNKQSIDLAKQRNKAEETINKQRIADQKSTFSTIATLQNSNNKYLAMIGKAAAITQIAIETPVAIAKALAAFPPPANFIAAGLVGVAMAAQAAQVAGISFEQGGIVPGTSFKGDRIQANVNSREMVLNVDQQKKLFDMANGKTTVTQDNSQTNALLAGILSAVQSGTSIQINGREIVNVVKDGLSSGRSLGYT